MNEKVSKGSLLVNKVKNFFTVDGLRKFGKLCYDKGTTYIIIIVLAIIFYCFNPRFLSAGNLYNILSGSTFYLIAGMGIMFVMLTGGIDLSVGYQMSIISCTSAILMLEFNAPVIVVILVSVVIGALCGLLNGVLAAKLKLFPLIITLATSEVFKGIAFNLTQGKTYSGMPEDFRWIYTEKFLGLPIDVYLAIAIIAIAWFVLNKTHFGRDVLAVGGSKEASRLSGINVSKTTMLAYATCSVIFAIATLDMMAQQNMTSATTGPGTEFTCLTAAIIGGVSMTGGKGNVIGMVVGIFIMLVITNGMQLANFGSYTQYIVKGIILLAAVSFDVIKNKPRVKVRNNDKNKPKEGLPPLDGKFPPMDGKLPPLNNERKDFRFAGGKPPMGFKIPDADISKVKIKYLDIAYNNESENQKLDIYLPEGEGPFPAIIYLHGGGFALGTKRDSHLDAILRGIEKGYAVIGVEYRLSGEAIFPAAVLDIRNAVRWIKEHASEYNIDPNRLASIGGSAGGNLSSMLAMNIKNGDFIGEENKEYKFEPTIKTAIDFYGPTNFKVMDEQARANGISFTDHHEPYSAESNYLGKPLNDVDYEYAQKANPMNYISKDMSPILIQHGRIDKLVPFQQSEIFVEAIRNIDETKVRFIPLDNADHDDKQFDSIENMENVWDWLKEKL